MKIVTIETEHGPVKVLDCEQDFDLDPPTHEELLLLQEAARLEEEALHPSQVGAQNETERNN